MDKLSVERIQSLHPDLRQIALDVLEECERELKGRAKVRFTFTFRTDAEQDGLYALGRTKVNPDGKSAQRPMGFKVTNAKGGQSIHNFGLAIDIALIIDGKTASWNDLHDYDGDMVSDWMECVKIFKKYGFTWGGDWSSFIDKPHFQHTFGLSLKQLQAKRDKKEFTEGTKYVNLTDTPTKEFKAVTGLNLRSGQGTEFPVILTIPEGSKVIELARVGMWSSVEFGSKSGWVSNKYLTKL